MASSFYWSVYKNLEKEVLDLSQWVFIDDSQLNTYSVKTADLLVRAAVEIESLSKALFFKYGGSKPDDSNLFFDTDCLAYLQDKIKIGSKVVYVSDVFQYCTKNDNLILRPLYNSWVRSKCDWKNAYQAIKHNRGDELKKGNIKNLLRALASLFILNLYYSDGSIGLGNDARAIGLDTRMGSDLFSIKVHVDKVNITETTVIEKQHDFDECVYVVSPTDTSVVRVRDVLRNLQVEVNSETNRRFQNKMNHFVSSGKIKSIRDSSSIPIEQQKPLMDEAYKEAYGVVYAKYNDSLRDVYQRVEYEAVLNLEQF